MCCESDYVLGVLTTVFQDHVKDGNFIWLGKDFDKHLQRVFRKVEYRSEKSITNSSVLVYEEENGTKVLWEGKLLLLLNISARNGDEPANFEFIQVRELMDTLDRVSNTLRYIRARWTTNDVTTHTFETLADA